MRDKIFKITWRGYDRIHQENFLYAKNKELALMKFTERRPQQIAEIIRIEDLTIYD